MKKILGLCVLLLTACSDKTDTDNANQFKYLTDLNVEILELVAAMPVEFPKAIEPSGLIMRDDSLFTVSDDHDHTIFYIDCNIEEQRATCKRYLKFDAPKIHGVDDLDLEGITVDGDGNFYLVSEKAFRILKIEKGSNKVSWVTHDLKPYGREVGLFQKKNADFEGITWLGDHKFLLAAEREPRGFIQLDLDKIPKGIKAYRQDHSILEPPKHRNPDYSGLHFDGKNIYALERSIHAVTRIEITDGKIIEKAVWSYAHVENAEEWQYRDMEFGHAEGLFINENYVYIILDNNGERRLINKKDRRPLMFVFKRGE